MRTINPWPRKRKPLSKARFVKRPNRFLVRCVHEQLGEIAAHLPNPGRPILSYYGGRSLHEQSHGESFLTLLTERFGGRGLYLLDEPEAALSPMRQMAAITRIHDLVGQQSQFLIATPYPGTRLRGDVLSQGRFLVSDWDQYGSYENRVYFEMGDLTEELVIRMQKKAYRSFYLRPGYILQQLFVPHNYRFFLRGLKGLWSFVLRG